MQARLFRRDLLYCPEDGVALVQGTVPAGEVDEPGFDGLRDKPRFRELVRKVGLAV